MDVNCKIVLTLHYHVVIENLIGISFSYLFVLLSSIHGTIIEHYLQKRGRLKSTEMLKISPPPFLLGPFRSCH